MTDLEKRVEVMEKKVFLTPRFETKINRAVFKHQDLVVYPDRNKRLPDNISNVTNGYPSFTIEGACYELRNVRTINADWTYQEVKE